MHVLELPHKHFDFISLHILVVIAALLRVSRFIQGRPPCLCAPFCSCASGHVTSPLFDSSVLTRNLAGVQVGEAGFI